MSMLTPARARGSNTLPTLAIAAMLLSALPAFASPRSPDDSERRHPLSEAWRNARRDVSVADDGSSRESTPFSGRDRNLPVWRFEFNNDTFVDSDNAFTAGWSLQYHSKAHDTWKGNGRFRWPASRILAKVFPGLDDDGEGGRVVRRSYGLSQQIWTPGDITVAAPQPNDIPWAGILGAYSAWSSYDNERLSAVQLYVGCLGPCSGARRVQELVHNDLGLGDRPAGWDNQLEHEWLGNLNLEYRRKLVVDDTEDYWSGTFSHDFGLGGAAAIGNYWTSATAQMEFRFGWGMPEGFTHIPDPPPSGVLSDPIYMTPSRARPFRRFRTYFSLVARGTYIERFVITRGGDTANGGRHPGLDGDRFLPQLIFGWHVGVYPVALHLTYYRYLDQRRALGDDSVASLDWVNISLEVRF